MYRPIKVQENKDYRVNAAIRYLNYASMYLDMGGEEDIVTAREFSEVAVDFLNRYIRERNEEWR